MPDRDRRDTQRTATSSATDCTGLMPALPEDAQQEEAYEQLYPTRQQPKPYAPTTSGSRSGE